MSIAESVAQRLVPGAFREFLPFVSPSGLRVIPKEKVLSLALDCVARTVSAPKYDDDYARIAAAIASSPLSNRIRLVRETANPFDPASVPAEKRIEWGEVILELYFFLIGQPVPLFIDLRPGSFGFNFEDQILEWQPSRLRIHRSEDFQFRIRELYRGFFRRTPDATANGIALYRWETEPTPGFDARMEALMRRHFGDAESASVRFSISHFRSTFHLVFEEAIASKSRFHHELPFIGAALAGLYVTLEKIGEPLDVAAAYARITP